MGIFGGLDEDRYDRQYTDSYLFRRLGTYFREQTRRLWILTAMGVGVSITEALIPIIIAAGVGELEAESGSDKVLLLVGALFLTIVARYFTNWVRRTLTVRIVADLVSQMRKDAFAAAVERDMAFYDENKTGKVLSRITNDTDDFGQILVVTSDIVAQLIQVIILSAVLLSRNVLLTLLLMLFTIPIVVAVLWFRKIARDVTRQGSRAMATVNDTIQETVTGISVAKNFRQEAAVYNDFVAVNEQSYRINWRRGMTLASVFPALNALSGFGTASIVYLGARAVLDSTINVSVWYLYVQTVDRFWFPLINIASYWSQFQQAMSSLERIFALIDAENVVLQTGDQPVGRLAGKIEFDRVVFEYKRGVRVLDDFCLAIDPGESVAFVGHTGAGKSTLAKLIMRFYEFQAGAIRVDGQDIRALNLHAYRSQLGFVPQMPFLFSGTIADNIRFGRPEATDEEISDVAYSIGNGEWLETLPDELLSDVGERGSRLSIGQRQLVSLLRVLIQKPAIFILDEATASIDQFTEAQIQEALELILAQSTSILIAHRLSTVRSADRIIVLREGEIIEQGNHRQLMQQGGHYAELYSTYFRHQSLSYVENARDMLVQD